ncbi:DUF4127 family protein [Deinococcus sp.]|uniref:DUF4127 family protein n=1 Tax=Deinococcus sp. TaxID=47478 RepID=UPI0025C45DBE|nr:DUF4127 family protein [Deinococcus sp.]
MLRAALLLSLVLLGSAQAQTLLPLDSRPATRVLPALIAGLPPGAAPSVPPATLLGNAKTGADPQALAAWIAAQPADRPLIVSLDALAYGGLVQSRNSPLDAASAVSNLQPLRDWGQRTGQPIYAFITLPRQPDATDRPRNLEVVRQMIAWAAEGVFRELHVTWDDALPGSPAPQEGAALARTAPENVHIYPGADEVLSMLVARAIAPETRSARVEYSDPEAARAVMKYEGIPLTQSAVNHAQASGFSVSEDPKPDLTLYVFNGGDPRQAALRISALLRKGQVAVADVAQVNLGNPKLWKDMTTLQRNKNLAALAAWGTPGNNLGTALAHAKVFLNGVNAPRQDALLAREYTNDVIFSGQLRAALRKAVPEKEMNTPAAQQTLNDLIHNMPVQMGNLYTLANATLPWGRSFEWDFDLQPATRP